MSLFRRPIWRSPLSLPALLLMMLGIIVSISLPAQISVADETPPATRIAVDEDDGSFTFISKGEPIARLDAAGLHIIGDVTYSGLLIDKNEAVRETLGGKAESSETKEE